MEITDEQVQQIVKLSRELKQLGDTPREVGPEHNAAQNNMASMGYELAGVVLEALEPAPQRIEQSEQNCQVCGEPTSHGADIDQGQGWRRVPVCDVGCLQELLLNLGSAPGSQVRSTYPSAQDQL